MRIAVAGTPEVAIPTFEALRLGNHEIVGAITRPDARRGRGRTLQPSPVAQWAMDHDIEVIRPVGADDAMVEALGRWRPDAVAVVAYGVLLPQSVLDLVPGGWINLHFSLLPRWRGAAPVQRSLLAGDEQIGVTTFRIVRALDAGPIFDQLRLPTPDQGDAGEMLALLAERGAEVMVRTMAKVAEGVEPTPQPDQGITIAPKLTTAEAELDLHADAESVVRQVRGLNPDPGTWTQLLLPGRDPELFKVVRIQVAPVAGDEGHDLGPGQLLATRTALLVGTGTSPVLLDQVKPSGKAVMRGADWARGARLGEPGVARLGSPAPADPTRPGDAKQGNSKHRNTNQDNAGQGRGGQA